MFITKLKLLSIPLIIFIITQAVLPARACEPPGLGFTWYLTQLSIDPITLPKGIEVHNVSTTVGIHEQDSLNLTNNSKKAVYIVYTLQKEAEIHDLYQKNQDNPDWTQQIETLNRSSESKINFRKIFS